MRNQMTYELRGQSTSSAGWVLTRGIGVLRGAARPGDPAGARASGPASEAGGAHDTLDRQCSDL